MSVLLPLPVAFFFFLLRGEKAQAMHISSFTHDSQRLLAFRG